MIYGVLDTNKVFMDRNWSAVQPAALQLKPTTTPGAEVRENGNGGWIFSIPTGSQGRYRLAQLDDYGALPRRDFPWEAPLQLSLQARASSPDIPGTWGFGLWNNPFGMAIFTGTEVLRLPTLPNAAWFFFASPPNYLSLRDDLPAQGGLAAAFRSPRLPGALLALGAPALPLLALPPAVRLLRRLARRLVWQSAALMKHEVADWHTYSLIWESERVKQAVDGETVCEIPWAPLGPLGFVVWIDNQYAAMPPSGRPGMGTLANPEPAWIEIQGLTVTRGE
jgi:hypothetical protein